MTDGSDPHGLCVDDHQRSPRKRFFVDLFACLALAFAIVAVGWSVFAGLGDGSSGETGVTEQAATGTSTEEADADLLAAFFDPGYSGFTAGTLRQSAPLPPSLRPLALASPRAEPAITQDPPPAPLPPSPRVAQGIPFPAPRPSVVPQSPSAPVPSASLGSKLASIPSDGWSTVQKLFGSVKELGPKLAYAPSDGGFFGSDKATIGPDRSRPFEPLTAVYDISARTVYMPDGTKLEAHSGFGSKMDDPRYVHVKMHGATPPHVYDLKMRERPFHGVRALRLLPVGGTNPLGRTGLLAHSYLLGPNGQSNGCVSFKDYDAFLQAYLNGKVERLVVVASRD